MTQEQLKKLKKDFVAKNKHATNGIKAAVGRGQFYARHLSRTDYNSIRRDWIDKLNEITAKYRETQSADTFILDVCTLKDFMNERHPDSFVDGEFTFGRAQKSLSVKLKYLWCDETFHYPEPPLCPIDSIIISKLGKNYRGLRWTKMGEEKYLAVYFRIQDLAKEEKVSIAEWELEKYNE